MNPILPADLSNCGFYSASDPDFEQRVVTVGNCAEFGLTPGQVGEIAKSETPFKPAAPSDYTFYGVEGIDGGARMVIAERDRPEAPGHPPTNPPACDALVSEAEQLQKGSLANEQLINDTLFSAYAAASAKRNAQIPQDTMVEPHLSKEPEGDRGSMTWEEIWVFQTQPKTAVRITFTEDGKGGADFSINAY